METQEILKNVKLFQGLSEKNIKQLAGGLRERSYHAGDLIIEQGKTGEGLFVIASGKVKITKKATDDSEIEVAVNGPGDFLGEMSVLDAAPRSASVVALEDTKCLVLVSWDFNAMMKANPEIALEILPVVVQRFRETNQKLLSMSSQ